MSEASVPVKKKRRGRPPGAKNKKTLVQEQIHEQAIELAAQRLSEQLVPIVERMCEKALEGDTAAAKLMLDRSIPTKRQSDQTDDRTPVVHINITASEVETGGYYQVEGEKVDEPEASADGLERSGSQGPGLVAVDGSAKG